ncbi:MAG TPA: DNA translocase FtsK 4TM domain-containing protein, partial [Egibacteraceae bacterium]|nr:DNA translocase FtsK 4TM domain-containing protein [Egibacteraceae bacterium]
PSRGSSGRPPAGRAASARKPPARRQAARKPDRAHLLGEHVRDAWGIGLLVLAGLAALELYAPGNPAGRVGIFLHGLFRGVFGLFGFLAPLALAGAGVMLLREPRPANARIVIGSVLTFASSMGLWHLLAGGPGMSAPLEELHDASGWAGALVALPLRSLAATWGAAVVLTALLVLGLLITTATPPRTVLRAIASAVRSALDWAAERRERGRVAAEELTIAEVDADAAPGEDPDAEAVTIRLDPDDSDDDPTGPIFIVAGVGDDDDPTGEIAVSDTLTMPQGVDTGGPQAATRLAAPDSAWADYELPSLSLLRTGRAAAGNKKGLDQMTRALEHTLHQFGVDASVSRVARGPTVTRFEIELGAGVKVSAVTKLGDDISYALATAEIRIVAPIPGKSAIGIEVPNRDRDLITLGDVLRSPEAEAAHHPLTAGIGVDIAGNPVLVNLATMPHLLIAGATGSGKSVTMNSIVTSVIMRSTPREARMILVDPKRVELNHYEGTPHLLTPVVTDPKRATEALGWTVKEMEDRYERLAMLGFRNIDAYNAAVRSGAELRAPALSDAAAAEAEGAAAGVRTAWEELPYILLVIDELADLMMVAPRDVESAIVRIAQMARAVGIHLIVATQRPSVDVVTGLIKANIPSRLALAMATQADSRTILDSGGAEKLVGHGDMLFLPANASKPHRIQGCYVDEGEISKVVGFCKGQREAEYRTGIIREGQAALMADMTGDDATDESLTRAAMELVVRSGLGSTSMLQRKLKVGFARAGRLMDELETMGVVGPSEGPKARHVLMSVEELDERLGS